MEILFNETINQCINATKKKLENLNKINIIVVGKAGVGKSTLINSIFRGNLAATGLGRPVTQEMRKIEKNGYPYAIYDTPGFELSEARGGKVKNDIFKLIEDKKNANDINERIHCIWYCINVGGNRIDPLEISWIKDFSGYNQKNPDHEVPIIIVLTQACPKNKANELKKLVEKENLNIRKVVSVLAQDINFDERHIEKAYGLDTLVEVLTEMFPDSFQETLQNIQKVSLKEKKKYSHAAVTTATAAAVGAASVPIPLADAAMLAPIQIGMISSITVAFGLDVNRTLLTSFVSSTIGSAGATVLGKTIVANILKLIPGGNVAGGLISATTAGLLTTALGEAYIKVMELIYKGEIKAENLYDEAGQKEMTKIFKKELKKKRKLSGVEISRKPGFLERGIKKKNSC